MISDIISAVEVDKLTDGQLDDLIAGGGEDVVNAVGEKISRLFDGLIGGMDFAILYTVVALVALGIVVGVLLYFFRRERLKDYAKVCFGVVAGFAIIATVLMAFVTFYQIQNYDGGSPDALFKPILSLVCIAVGGGCLMGIGSLFSKLAVKVAAGITGAGMLAAFIAAMVLMTRYYNESQAEWYPSLSTTGLAVTTALAIVVLVVAFVFGKKKDVSDTRAIVYGAISIAMAFALSYARFIHLPQGGSVTFASLLPLMIYCAMFGTRRGIVVCLIYGFLQALQDTYIIHPLQFLIDYPLAFGMIGVSGFFFERTPLRKNKIVAFAVGAIVAVTLRYACHICSGVFAFADYADLEKYDTAVAYSFGYNSFTIVDLAIDLAAGIFLFLSKAFRRQMDIAVQPASGAALDDVDFDDDEEAAPESGQNKSDSASDGEAAHTEDSDGSTD